MKHMLRSLIALLSIIYLNCYGQGPSTPATCDQLTLVQCEQFVMKELGKLKSSDIQSIIALSGVWGSKFRPAYQATIKKGPSSADIDQIEKKIKEELDPMEKIKSKATEQILIRYFPRLATWVAFLSSAPVEGLAIFLTPSETVSPFDEVIQANNRVQDKIHVLLEPNLRSDWKDIYSKTLNNVGPQIGPSKP